MTPSAKTPKHVLAAVLVIVAAALFASTYRHGVSPGEAFGTRVASVVVALYGVANIYWRGAVARVTELPMRRAVAIGAIVLFIAAAILLIVAVVMRIAG